MVGATTPRSLLSATMKDHTQCGDFQGDLRGKIQSVIENSALVKSLRRRANCLESRPLSLPDDVRREHLVAGLMSGSESIPVTPYSFLEQTQEGYKLTMILYVGPNLSGHPGWAHGGFIATLLDESIARCAFQAMPTKVGVTANLSINYRKPIQLRQYLVVTARTVRTEGRKVFAEGWIEKFQADDDNYEQEILAEASAVVVSLQQVSSEVSLITKCDTPNIAFFH
ncbi:HotDog domain-containing protein [Talaromyces proteolyticus]|uniref:HotDog domain-containing protein n=1 Tax=Talaromyces proteolyticus TaxID=1131652 RepID=A0AAD4KTC2_9EURO|nr:HotDog domain-containing protein [Talaromyces proteolyticus]KAH8698858.1 HotDog domain-containing protein [Talaromyces proteolyticus]